MDRIALFGESKTDIRIRPARPFGNMATSPMSMASSGFGGGAVTTGAGAAGRRKRRVQQGPRRRQGCEGFSRGN